MREKLTDYWRTSKAMARAGHLPVWRQWLEIACLFLTRTIGPGFYQSSALYRRDMSFSAKRRFLLGKRYAAAVNRYNDHRYQILVRHKLVEKALLQQFGIRTPRLHGYYHPQYGSTPDGGRLRSSIELQTLLLDLALPCIAVKQAIGAEGKGFDIIDLDQLGSGHIHSRARDESMPLDDYFSFKLAQSPGDGLILEDVIQQHPVLAALNDSSVNTIRFWVTQLDERATVRSAALKIGFPGSLVDYTTRGGAAAKIDINSGHIDSFRPRVPSVESPRQSFPDSLAVPFFREARDLAERALEIFPELDFAGLDVAIDAQGALIVELNDEPGINHPGLVGIPTLDLLEPLPPPRDPQTNRRGRRAAPSTHPHRPG